MTVPIPPQLFVLFLEFDGCFFPDDWLHSSRKVDVVGESSCVILGGGLPGWNSSYFSFEGEMVYISRMWVAIRLSSSIVGMSSKM